MPFNLLLCSGEATVFESTLIYIYFYILKQGSLKPLNVMPFQNAKFFTTSQSTLANLFYANLLFSLGFRTQNVNRTCPGLAIFNFSEKLQNISEIPSERSWRKKMFRKGPFNNAQRPLLGKGLFFSGVPHLYIKNNHAYISIEVPNTIKIYQ